MFRLSNLIAASIEDRPQRTLDGAIAIWNFTNRCNLSCLHCYSKAELHGHDRLTTEQIFHTIPQLKRGGIRFVIFSGGEPLVRRDIFQIAQRMREEGIITYLSTNGLYIHRHNVAQILESFNYIGISIDGNEEIHDRFRGLPGSYRMALKAIDLIHDHGGRVGIRFTITKETKGALEHIFQLAQERGIAKVYISHLVYSGRGLENLAMDLTPQERRTIVAGIIERALEYYRHGRQIEIVTGNMEMDAIMLYQRLLQENPIWAQRLLERLEKWGGNSAGRNLVNIDSQGNVKPDPFFPVSLGSLFEGPFDEIWLDEEHPLLRRLREHPRKLGGRCGQCQWIAICNGGSRPRAWAVHGDLWAEDPSCYIDGEESPWCE
ncbi:MAG: radical SAM/SPASM domain-containing protein [Nitratiruptor sp.]|nr:radical SAM/SPASM domain-containing protein [Nitratiruptor sp.]NPA83518.1 radical SAM protein [Campylobacterota bacterium]